MTGTLIGIVRKPARHAPMESLTSVKIWQKAHRAVMALPERKVYLPG